MQISILNGIYTDRDANFRSSYPRNLIPVPKQQGISQGYLRPADGIDLFAVGAGVDRGGINWNGICYRASGEYLIKVHAGGSIEIIGFISNDGLPCSFDYSFDRLCIVSAKKMFYLQGGVLSQVTDADVGLPTSVVYVDGYFMFTDNTSLIVTNLSDPATIDILKYGSAEIDPDNIQKVLKLRNEPVAVGRYTLEFFSNTGGSSFPFQRIGGASVFRGSVGKYSACIFQDAVAFVGGARNEPPAVWLGVNGQTSKISTREIDQILQSYTTDELATILVEARIELNHSMLLIHLPNKTLVYDFSASQAMSEQIWFTLDSGLVEESAYEMRNLVWCYDKWIGGDANSSKIGAYNNAHSNHYGIQVGWCFSTQMVYNESKGAIFHELELVALPGRVAFNASPVVWTSYSVDGELWTQEKAKEIGKSGDRNSRITWFQQGHMRNWRIQKFRGNSDAFISFARLEARVEALNV